MEQERKKQLEFERQLQKQREIQQEHEEQRRKALEQREVRSRALWYKMGKHSVVQIGKIVLNNDLNNRHDIDASTNWENSLE